MTPTATLAHDVAHLLGGAALALSFALLYQRRIAALATLCGLQSLTLAAAAAWQGWLQESWPLFATAAIVLAGHAVACPIALRRLAGQAPDAGTALGTVPTMTLGVALVALAMLAVPPSNTETAVLTREDLAPALSVVLLAVLLLLSRRDVLAQVVGLLSLQNGVLLVAIRLPGLPLLMELAVAMLALIACVLFAATQLRAATPDATPP
jgi:hydrogenase-4 component E